MLVVMVVKWVLKLRPVGTKENWCVSSGRSVPHPSSYFVLPRFVEQCAPSRVCIHGANHHHARFEGCMAKGSGHYPLGFAELPRRVEEALRGRHRKAECCGSLRFDAAPPHAFKSVCRAFAPRSAVPSRLALATVLTRASALPPLCARSRFGEIWRSPRSSQNRGVVRGARIGCLRPG